MSIYLVRVTTPIDRSLVPNLRRLKIYSNNYYNGLEALTQLFCHDVFFHLTHFSFVGEHLKNEFVQELLSMLSTQCCYSLDLRRCQVTAPMVFERSVTNNILLNTFRQLNGCKPMEVTFEWDVNEYNLCAYTLPRKCHELDVMRYLNAHTVLA